MINGELVVDNFAVVSANSRAYGYGASTSAGVRPAFMIR